MILKRQGKEALGRLVRRVGERVEILVCIWGRGYRGSRREVREGKWETLRLVFHPFHGSGISTVPSLLALSNW